MTTDTDVAKPLTKAQLVKVLAEKTGLTPKEVTSVLTNLADVAVAELKRPEVAKFTVPGLLKITRKTKPATAERQGVNPFTKAPMTIKAKPKKEVVRASAVKALKDAVNGV